VQILEKGTQEKKLGNLCSSSITSEVMVVQMFAGYYGEGFEETFKMEPTLSP